MRPGENSSGRMVIAIHKKQEGDIISEQSIHITALDKETYDSTAQVLKAAIPYADRTTGKFLAVYARFLEFKKTLDYFNQPEPQIKICALSGSKPSPEEILHDLKKYSDPNQAEMIDRMLNILQMTKFLEKYKELEKSPEFAQMMRMMKAFGSDHDARSFSGQTMQEPADPPPQPDSNKAADPSLAIADLMNQLKHPDGINQLKNMLTPEQRQMYETIMSMNSQNSN